MNLSNIAVAVDSEWDGDRLIELGFTEIDLKKREILKTYSVPIKRSREDKISEEIHQLTGWTAVKLEKQGYEFEKAFSLFRKRCCNGRLIIIDTKSELVSSVNWFFDNSTDETDLILIKLGIFDLADLNTKDISIDFALKTGEPSNLGLDKMLEHYNIVFEGKRHRAADDSRNIAKLFLEVWKSARLMVDIETYEDLFPRFKIDLDE